MSWEVLATVMHGDNQLIITWQQEQWPYLRKQTVLAVPDLSHSIWQTAVRVLSDFTTVSPADFGWADLASLCLLDQL